MSALARELSKSELENILTSEIEAKVSFELRKIHTRIQYLEVKEEQFNLSHFRKLFEDLMDDLTWRQYNRLPRNRNYFENLKNIQKVSKSHKIHVRAQNLERYLREILLFQERAETYSWFQPSED